ncbi:MAG: hypothetical protein ABI064_04580, partial [Acidobacteriaceae bacterium]
MSAKADAPLLPWKTRLRNTFAPRTVYAQTQAQQDDAAIDSAMNSGKKGMNTTFKAVHAVVDDWDTEFNAKPEGGKLHLTLKMTRSLETVVSEIDGDGYLQDFDTLLDTSVSGASVSQMEGAFKDVNGAMNITWKIGQKTVGGDGKSTRIDLPGAVNVSLAPLLDGLPINLEVGGAVIVQPVTTGANEFASGSFHVTYDGYQSFKLKGSSLDTDGSMNMNFDPGAAQNISLAPTAMVLALAAPEIQLEFGGPALDVFKVGGLKDAASKVDGWADMVAKKYLSDDAYQQWKAASDLVSKAISAVQDTGALAYLRVLTTTTSMQSGSAIMFPCTRETWNYFVTVGASAQALGLPTGSLSKRIAEKT